MQTFMFPNIHKKSEDEVLIYFGGTETFGASWQKEFSDYLSMFFSDNVVLSTCNGRDSGDVYQLCQWREYMAKQCDIFCMFFADTDSRAHQAFYDLGRNICKMQMKFPLDWQSRILIFCDAHYRDRLEVYFDTYLSTGIAPYDSLSWNDDTSQLLHQVQQQLSNLIPNAFENK